MKTPVIKDPWDWKPYTNPEGQPYYYAESRRLIVSCDIYQGTVKAQIEDQADLLLVELKEKGVIFSFDWEWELIWKCDEEVTEWRFVNHTDQLLFNLAIDSDARSKDASKQILLWRTLYKSDPM